MTLSHQSITEFQEIYRRVFGKKITREEAVEQGEKLLRLFRLIYQPLSLSNVLTPKGVNI